MSELHDLAAPYVLDALDDDERRAFEAHLETCASCLDTVAELEAGALVLAESQQTEPPAHLRGQVLDAIEQTPQDAVVVDLATRRRNRVVTGMLAAAALILAVVATVSIVQSSRVGTVEEILTAPDVQTVELVGETAAGRFTYSLDVGRGVFVSGSLAAVDPNRTYQLWLIGDAGPEPAGLFVPNASGRSTAVVDDVTAGLVLGITEEPAGGSEQPTGEVLLAAEV